MTAETITVGRLTLRLPALEQVASCWQDTTGQPELERATALILLPDARKEAAAVIAAATLPVPGAWDAVDLALGWLAEAAGSRDRTAGSPLHGAWYPCCDGDVCACHAGPARDGQPCGTCVDRLDAEVRTAADEVARTVAHLLGEDQLITMGALL